MIWNFEVIVAVIGSLGAAGFVLWQLADPGRRRNETREHNDDTGAIVEEVRQNRNEDD
ncbi:MULTISPECIES: hypothetical protein [Rhizobium]|uniref:hypothetical protein n=1 Tax=Rhizobium TaxID=379 RepID=UPI0013AFC257|nr:MULTISPECIES: hypothetical protein [Rhizobium]MBB3290212.1 hypothetical protein [Rhizobium sp. BK252]MBB3404901.1 hypothetical protein [Rhizobium sp. BK289]MBB3417447.1 hypothetical protein [Rhizobium sp. BK284]MBB3485157.1 hypothetical protein [Rhizobium sp. BK347]MDK4721006.1 hypothetical protein [Rhizobium sp. CNPSo 3968]